MRRRDHNIFANATSLLICGLLAGVVVAAAAFPAAAMTGLAAKAGSDNFAALPSELTDFSSPQISRIYASDGKTQIGQFYDEYRNDVKLTDMSKYMPAAIIAAEDRTFYQDNGVDFKGVARAFVSNNQGNSKQGASTITMQYVRMALAYSATSPQQVVDATQDTAKRKITEMKYAMQLNKELTKNEILERYLNIAPFGNQAYGVYAASQVYFHENPSQLTPGQASMLAGMVKAPTSFNPVTPSGYKQIQDRRNNYIIPAMVQAGSLTAAQGAAAIKEAIPKQVYPVANGCVSVTKNSWGFFCDYFYRWWLDQPAFGATQFDREQRLKDGGYTIVTTMNATLEDQMRSEISKRIKDDNKNAAVVAAVEPGDGEVRAISTNRHFSLDNSNNPKSPDKALAKKGVRSTYPNTTNPLITGGGAVDGYQAGSTFKLFTMVAALEQGIPLTWTFNAPGTYVSKYPVEASDPAACQGTHWCPTNASGEGEAGTYNMWSGFGQSVNTFFVPLEERAGAQNAVSVAERFGITFRSTSDANYAKNASSWGAFTLGVSQSTPLDMANAYSVLAGDGKYCPATPIQQITTQDGEKLDVGKSHCQQATSVDIARSALDAARCPVGDTAQLGSCGGSGTAPDTRNIVGHPVYGKTGTTDGSKTAALIAGTTSLVVAGYLVNPDFPQHADPEDHHVINPIVQYTLKDYMKGKPKVQFKTPGDDKVALGDQRSIPDVSCEPISEAQSQIDGAGFSAQVGSSVSSNCPAGTAAQTEPSGKQTKGGVVIIDTSKGGGGNTPGTGGVTLPTPGGPTKPKKPGH